MDCRNRAALSRSSLRRVGLWISLLIGFWAAQPAQATGIADTWADTWAGIYWGELSSALLAHFGGRATPLQQPIDFGDSYAQIVLRSVLVGGVPLVGFFQMDKTTGGLRRIQLERQRHGVNPPAFRAVLGALEAAYGAPDAMCDIAPGPAGGYQAAAERVWLRDGRMIRAIFRDTTIAAFEDCPAGDPSMAGPCGLTGQLLIRISPPEVDGARCPCRHACGDGYAQFTPIPQPVTPAKAGGPGEQLSLCPGFPLSRE